MGTHFTPNLIVAGEGFYISYNDVAQAIYGSDTTALVVGQMERFYILNGDHRERYAELVGDGLDACRGYYRENIALSNSRSDVLEEDASGPRM